VKIALTIAGSDSGGGAGIQADLKTFHQFGVFGTSVITAVTAQNTLEVTGWDRVRPELVAMQIAAVAKDLPPVAFKSGMLADGEVVRAVAEAIELHRLKNYVLDPVMIATSGDSLAGNDAAAAIAARLVPRALLVTPNLHEASVLTGKEVRATGDMTTAGKALIAMGAEAALIKGGHLEREILIDVLVTKTSVRRYEHSRRKTTSTHGTGCVLSAAITAGLALGRGLEESVTAAVDFVQRAIAAAPAIGGGHGPLGLFVDPL
jgi:hydroxymethylpyrimidine/phosphomethylpyrimidine kinase